MATHSLYPGFTLLKIASNGHTHDHRLAVDPVEVGGEWSVRNNAGTTTPFETAAVAYANILAPLYSDSSTILSAELYTMSSPDADPLFVQAVDLGTLGTSVSADVPYCQSVLSFRTSVGGILKITLLEATTARDVRLALAAVSGATGDLREYILGTSGWIMGRNLGKAVYPLFLTSKINDVLRKKYLLDA